MDASGRNRISFRHRGFACAGGIVLQRATQSERSDGTIAGAVGARSQPLLPVARRSEPGVCSVLGILLRALAC